MTLINQNVDTKITIPKKTPKLPKIPIHPLSVTDKRTQDQSQVSAAPILPANIQEYKENLLRESTLSSNSPSVRKGTYTITKTAQSCSERINVGASNTSKINVDPANYNESEINQTDPYHSARESMMTLKEQLSATIHKERTPQKKIPNNPATFNFGTLLASVVFIGILSYHFMTFSM